TSDDGSILYIDNQKIIDNDREHQVEEKHHSVKLKEGLHSIRVSYYQGPRFEVALVLQVARPGEHGLRVFHTDDFLPPGDRQDLCRCGAIFSFERRRSCRRFFGVRPAWTQQETAVGMGADAATTKPERARVAECVRLSVSDALIPESLPSQPQ